MQTSFGKVIAKTRKALNMSQKELAEKIQREGKSISPQYLNDIEHDRRNPSSDELVKQFASVLGLNADYLYFLADRFPADIRKKNLSSDTVSELLTAFRRQSK